MVRKDKQTIVTENTATLSEDGCQLPREQIRISVLHLTGASRSHRWRHIENLIQPVVEKICKLRIVDVVEEGRICDDQADALVW